MCKENEVYDEFYIHPAILAMANISPGRGLAVTIHDGSIVITSDDEIPEDVYRLCEHFGISRAKTRAVLQDVAV